MGHMTKFYNPVIIFLLKYNTIKKKQIGKEIENFNLNISPNNNKKCKVENIQNNAIYVSEAQD